MRDSLQALGVDPTIIPQGSYPHLITYDYEAKLAPDGREKGGKTRIVTTHTPMSFAISSNIPGQEDFFESSTSDGQSLELAERFIKELERLSDVSYQILRPQFEDVFTRLEEIRALCTLEREFRAIDRAVAAVERYIRQVPTLGFNSGKYDMGLIEDEFIHLLQSKCIQVIKKTERI